VHCLKVLHAFPLLRVTHLPSEHRAHATVRHLVHSKHGAKQLSHALGHPRRVPVRPVHTVPLADCLVVVVEVHGVPVDDRVVGEVVVPVCLREHVVP
jgi:hypothetical protein